MTEFAWVINVLREMDKGSIYRAASRVSEALFEINCTQTGEFWETIGRKFAKKRNRNGGVHVTESETPLSSASST
jgi:hypothetical protein